MPVREQPQHLGHLDGARFLAALWIVCAHFLPLSPDPILHGAGFRVNVAVCFFVVTSGFVTHWAYGSKELSTSGSFAQFYARRLGRVVFTFWVTMAFAISVAWLEGIRWNFWYLTRCFLFVEQWFHWCPNGPSWFVFALLPSWILYPYSRRIVSAVAKNGAGALTGLLLMLWMLSFGPALALFIIQGGNITWQQHADMSFWPPAQAADFGIGMVAAALVQQLRPCIEDAGEDGGERGAKAVGGLSCARRPAIGWLADGLLAFIFVVVTAVPRAPRTYQLHLNGWEPLMDHGFAVVIAGFLIASALAPGHGFGARLFSHKALASLGERSFEVYLFQRPVHDLFVLLLDTSSAEVFVVYLLSLWALASLYGTFVQDPVDRWIRSGTADWAALPYSAADKDNGAAQVAGGLQSQA